MNFIIIQWFFIFTLCASEGQAKNFGKRCHLRKGDESCLSVNVVKIVDATQVFVSIKNLENLGSFDVYLYGVEGPSLKANFDKDAKERIKKLFEGENLTLNLKKDRDSRGRLLGTFYSGKTNINIKLIQDGIAWCRKSNSCPKILGHENLLGKSSSRSSSSRSSSSRSSSSRSSSSRPSSSGSRSKTIVVVKPFKSKNNYRKKEKFTKLKINYGKKTKFRKLKNRKKFGKSDRVKIMVEILRIIDGDTVLVRKVGDENIIKVRMKGIDAPEMNQKFGEESKKYLSEFIHNAVDPFYLIIYGEDVYGRTIGKLMLGNIDINKEVIASGYAWCYRHTECPDSYQEAMKTAQQLRKGLFIQDNPQTPWDFRKMYKNNTLP